MAVKWTSSRFPGVRFYEHSSRKHGVKFDRYFAIRAQVSGKRREEGLGWASEGWSEQKAATVLAELKKAHTTGEGAYSLAEKRAKAETERKALQEEEACKAREDTSFAQVWDKYFPIAQQNKAIRSCEKEEQCYRLWIAPVIGSKPLKAIAPIHLERIKKNMADRGRAPRSAAYVLAVVRQVINFASNHDIFTGNNPVGKVIKPKSDNRRIRFLTSEEAYILLEALEKRSPDIRNMALLSLYAGLRAGEIFALTWADIDIVHNVLTLRDTKSSRTRQVPMTSHLRTMFQERLARATGNSLIFPSKTGGKVGQISQTFVKTVHALGLNNGITDSRQKVVFHTLRHTYASWLVQRGTPLYTVAKLLGHASLTMTERYSHLAPDHFKQAVACLESPAEEWDALKAVNINGGSSS